MSAWIVSKKHIDLMVKAVMEGTRDGALKSFLTDRFLTASINPDSLGSMLVKECVDSVSYRYPGDYVSDGELPGPCHPYYVRPYVYEDPKYRPTAVELFKAVDCYDYQSCEHPGWKSSKAMQLCDEIRFVIASAVKDVDDKVKNRGKRGWEWPEYDDAPWGFNTEEIALCFARSDPEGRTLLRAVKDHPGDSLYISALSDWLMERNMIDGSLVHQDIQFNLRHASV